MNTQPVSREPSPGVVIAGRFRLLRMLGQGGMGSVWAAHHLGLDSEVALKFIDPDIADRVEILSRFSQEAVAAAKIKSPHVVSILDHGIDDQGRAFIAMELLRGEDLASRLDRVGHLTLDETAEIIRQAAKGLGKAHAAGVVHRDLKPENIFLCDDEEGGFVAKILDFGIAKSSNASSPGSSHKTATGQIIGTPTYMSPEQALGRQLDFRSDLYSLAVVAYRCVAGRAPFTYEAVGELIVAVSTLPAPPPSSFRTGLPHSIDQWFERALKKDPTERFASAKALGETFKAACDGEPPSSVLRGRASLAELNPPSSDPMIDMHARTMPLVDAANNTPVSAASATPRLGGLRTLPPTSKKTPALAIVGTLVVAAAAAGAFVAMRPRGDAAPKVVPSGAVAEPPSSTVSVKLMATPASATIFWDGQPLGQNPYAGSKAADGAPHRVRAEAEGHKAVEQMVVAVADKPIELSLSLEPLGTQLATPGTVPIPIAPPPSAQRPTGMRPPRTPTPTTSSSAPSTPPPVASTPADPGKKSGVSLDKDDPWQKK